VEVRVLSGASEKHLLKQGFFLQLATHGRSRITWRDTGRDTAWDGD